MFLPAFRDIFLSGFSQERSYKPINIVDQMAVHFVLEGSLVHQDSEEARKLGVKEGLAQGIYWNILQ